MSGWQRVAPLFVCGWFASLCIGCGSDDATTPEAKGPKPFKVMTYNVLCSFCKGDEYDPWDDRQGYFRDIFSRHDADLYGLQELSFGSEVDQMLGLVDGFSSVYYAAADSNFTYPDASILYRTERFELEDSGEFWLSPTPDVPSSIGFAERQVPRLVVWAKLFDKQSDASLVFASTHVDNNSPSQALSAPLILERLEPFAAEAPLVLLGDFNSKPDTEAYGILTTSEGFHLVNTQGLADTWEVDTNQEPAPDYDLDDRIDHIFVAPDSAAWSVSHWAVDVHEYGPNQRYASDHFPMAATLLAGER
ncbi:MAG: endonuclease/exonuclease/phosphatase family protein [Myxococcales bacterium]|nr:endonuclease/exonuclease/phosphatase family protein [Myxococcales bacterium]